MMVLGTRRLSGLTIALVCALAALPAASGAAPGGQGQGKPSVGERSLGDPLLPQLGNGGYDVGALHDRARLRPGGEPFTRRRRRSTPRPTRSCSEFSLDFQDDFDVSAVTVDGRAAGFAFEAATPDLSPDPRGHPTDEAGRRPAPVRRGRRPGGTSRSWSATRAPRSRSSTLTSRSRAGSPPATRSTRRRPATAPSSSTSRWAPRAGSRRTTTRATRRRSTPSSRCPTRKTALGVGELVEPHRQRRRHDDLALARGRPDRHVPDDGDGRRLPLHRGLDGRDSTGRTLPIYNAIDATRDARPAGGDQRLARPGPGPAQLPERPLRALPVRLHRRRRRPGDRRRLRARGADQAALRRRVHERQPVDQHRHPAPRARPPVGRQQRHARAWDDIWFNEGWANWAEWHWQFVENGGDDPAAIFDDLYASTPADDWAIAPACSTVIPPTCSSSSRPTTAGR